MWSKKLNKCHDNFAIDIRMLVSKYVSANFQQIPGHFIVRLASVRRDYITAPRLQGLRTGTFDDVELIMKR